MLYFVYVFALLYIVDFLDNAILGNRRLQKMLPSTRVSQYLTLLQSDFVDTITILNLFSTLRLRFFNAICALRWR